MITTIFDNSARLARKSLELMSHHVTSHKEEFGLNEFHLSFTKAAVARLPLLSKAVVDKAVVEMELDGYKFNKKQSGVAEIYDLTVEQIVDIYRHRGIKPCRETHPIGEVLFIANLKGGVSKTVTSVNLAHSLRVHPNLIKEDLRILVIDLDPQSSATLFLDHTKAIGLIDFTAAQAMLQDVSREDLHEHFILKSVVNNVDVIPASISDGFLASEWVQLCETHLPGQNPNLVLKENLTDKLKYDYDFILIDSGPHLDAFLKNSMVAADVMMTPIPPSQIDLHSTLQYVGRLPIIFKNLVKSGVLQNDLPSKNIAFMTKFSKTVQDIESQSIAKNIFGSEMLDAVIPDLSAFKRCGETFDTVITANPITYLGDKKALKKARESLEEFSLSVFNHLQFLRRK